MCFLMSIVLFPTCKQPLCSSELSSRATSSLKSPEEAVGVEGYPGPGWVPELWCGFYPGDIYSAQQTCFSDVLLQTSPTTPRAPKHPHQSISTATIWQGTPTASSRSCIPPGRLPHSSPDDFKNVRGRCIAQQLEDCLGHLLPIRST